MNIFPGNIVPSQAGRFCVLSVSVRNEVWWTQTLKVVRVILLKMRVMSVAYFDP